MGNIDSDEEDEQIQSSVARRRNTSLSGMHIPSAARAERLAARKVTSHLVHSAGKQKGDPHKHEFNNGQVFRRKSVMVREVKSVDEQASSSRSGRNRRESVVTQNFGGIDRTTPSTKAEGTVPVEIHFLDGKSIRAELGADEARGMKQALAQTSTHTLPSPRLNRKHQVCLRHRPDQGKAHLSPPP